MIIDIKFVLQIKSIINSHYTNFTMKEGNSNYDTNSNSFFKTAQKTTSHPAMTDLQTPHPLYISGSAVKKIRMIPITMKDLTLQANQVL